MGAKLGHHKVWAIENLTHLQLGSMHLDPTFGLLVIGSTGRSWWIGPNLMQGWMAEENSSLKTQAWPSRASCGVQISKPTVSYPPHGRACLEGKTWGGGGSSPLTLNFLAKSSHDLSEYSNPSCKWIGCSSFILLSSLGRASSLCCLALL